MNHHDRTEYAALLTRLSLGIMYLTHSIVLKVMTFGIEGTAGYFASIGYPAWLAHAVIAVEAIGGLLLVLGVQTRWVSLALIPVLIGATIEHIPNGWVFSATHGGWEYPVFLIAISLVQALLGNGAYALGKTESYAGHLAAAR